MKGKARRKKELIAEPEEMHQHIAELETLDTARALAKDGLHRLATVLRDSNDAITLQDLDGRLLAWNRGAEVMYGYTEAEALKMNISTLVPAGERKGRVPLAQRLSRGETIESFETQRVTKDGRILDVWMTVTALKDDRGKICAIGTTERDITARKRADQALAGKTEELARSNAELEQFAYVASHDLQEPLRKLVSYTNLLAQRYQGKLDSNADKFIGYIVDAATRMQGLIDGLLTLSRIGGAETSLEPTHLEAVLHQVLADIDTALEDSGAVVTFDPLPTVKADASQMKQLLQNLIGNAIKFHGTDPPRIHVSAQQKHHQWVFSIRDNGIGIDPQYAERIFLVFQRLHTRAEYPGTGIGLAICKKIVERHGGRIWVESCTGKGATFYFTLPARQIRLPARNAGAA